MVRSSAPRRVHRQPFNRFAAWLGVVALLVQVAIPLGQAVPAAGNDDFLIVCSTIGAKRIPVPTSERQRAGGSNCPVCQVMALGAQLLPPPHPIAAPARHAVAATPVFHAAETPHAAATVRRRLPRGPPRIV